MLQSLKYFFFILWSIPVFCEQIHVIYTSALIPKQFEQRKQEYLKSFYQLKAFGFEPWIIEATKINSSFFDQITNQVLYPQTNDLTLRNKGVNETMSMRASLPYLHFADDDIVLKMTGRYFIKDRFFIDSIQATSSDYDVWGCFGKNFVGKGHLFTGCFAMRWKYLKKIISEMDLEVAEKDYIAVEKLIGDFIHENQLRVNYFSDLHVLARIFFSGEDSLDFEF
jgi:hypothetical protein